MILYIIRHGKAVADSPTGRDEGRALRNRGREQIAWLSEQIADEEAPPDAILASPVLRARQTAEILAEALGCEIEEEATLALGHPAADVVDVVETFVAERACAALAIVGHNPQLESLVGAYCSGVSGHTVRLRTGQCAIVSFAGAAPREGEGSLVQSLRFEG